MSEKTKQIFKVQQNLSERILWTLPQAFSLLWSDLKASTPRNEMIGYDQLLFF